jgi:hypothetical protein
MGFWFCGATEKAAIAIAAAKWADGERGQESFEEAAFFGTAGVTAVARRAAKSHGPYLFSEESWCFPAEVQSPIEGGPSYTGNAVEALGIFL